MQLNSIICQSALVSEKAELFRAYDQSRFGQCCGQREAMAMPIADRSSVNVGGCDLSRRVALGWARDHGGRHLSAHIIRPLPRFEGVRIICCFLMWLQPDIWQKPIKLSRDI